MSGREHPEARVFGTVAVQVVYFLKKPAVDLLACVTAKRISLANSHACLVKCGWTIERCNGDDEEAQCYGTKSQMNASLNFYRDWTGAPDKGFANGRAHWRSKPLNVFAWVVDRDRATTWLDALEKSVSQPTP